MPVSNSDLLHYMQDIRIRGSARTREWFWEKNAYRPRPLAYFLEYEPFTLLLKVHQFIHRTRKIRPLMRAQKPTGSRLTPGDFSHIIPTRPELAGNKKLILIHAFYENESKIIFDKLKPFTDYDLLLTTPKPEIQSDFLSRFDSPRAAAILLPNLGRDILPFLLAVAYLDLSPYTHFIKIHTKRSTHLTYGGDWFWMNIESLIGNKQMTDELLSLIAPETPSIFGVQTRPLHDHYRNNRPWLTELMQTNPRQVRAQFIPGTMFAGSAEFLQLLAQKNLHLHKLEPESGQLDGCFIHALERYFGFLAQSHAGRCATFESLIGLT
jgi:lipopolysaccharide biosynthesis protein